MTTDELTTVVTLILMVLGASVVAFSLILVLAVRDTREIRTRLIALEVKARRDLSPRPAAPTNLTPKVRWSWEPAPDFCPRCNLCGYGCAHIFRIARPKVRECRHCERLVPASAGLHQCTPPDRPTKPRWLCEAR